MYARNVQTLLLHIGKGGKLDLDLDDEIIDGTLLTHGGARSSTRPRFRP